MGTDHHTGISLLCNSGCGIFFRISVGQIRRFRMFESKSLDVKPRLIENTELTYQTKMGRQVVHTGLRKGNSLKIICFYIYSNVFLICCMETCELPLSRGSVWWGKEFQNFQLLSSGSMPGSGRVGLTACTVHSECRAYFKRSVFQHNLDCLSPDASEDSRPRRLSLLLSF